MTTRTQWVRNVPDSHLKRLILQTVFHVAQESQPGKTIGVLSRLVVTGENPANHVFVELEMERRPFVEQFADSPSWDYVASFRRPHG